MRDPPGVRSLAAAAPILFLFWGSRSGILAGALLLHATGAAEGAG